MRKLLAVLAVLSMLAMACSPEEEEAAPSAAPSGEALACDVADLSLLNAGVLTVGTGNPAYPPWWEGGEDPAYEDWKINSPYNGKGFEGAFVAALASEMGFAPDALEFVPVPFGKSYAPGPKDFDFVLQQISYSDKRAQNVDFSQSYYDVNQALVALEDSSIAGATTMAELKEAKLGAMSGTTSYDYIVSNIQPNTEPDVYPGLNEAIQDLKNGQIDGLVTDLPGAYYITAVQIPNGKIVGQFPPVGGQEYFALVFPKGSALVPCVDQAIQAMKDSGQLEAITMEWLSAKTAAPFITE